ncbi:LCP family protein [Actinoplanes sp. NPDC049548]|uniref:LCP family protein n=1 Tax=Actinoplanes sp. NPDC049548 TaxID=3155152 RepID=UPI0034253700
MSPIDPSPIEEELRAAFARHEAETPAAGPLRAKIDIAWVRAKRRRRARRTAGVAAALLVATLPVPVLVERWQHSAPVTSDLLGTTSNSLHTVAGPVDVLLLGSDDRTAADTVTMVHVPADRSRAYLVSLPGDGAVRDAARLSTTLSTGGPKHTERVVSDLTGVDFTATVTVDFRAVRAVTEAVGGVQLCRPQSAGSGCRQVGPDDVTTILRGRYGTKNSRNDGDRNAHRFLRSLAAKLVADGAATDPLRLDRFLDAAGSGITIDGDAQALLQVAGSTRSAEVVGISAPSSHTLGDGREQIYPGVGPGLYEAIRSDRLAEWVRAHPAYVLT